MIIGGIATGPILDAFDPRRVLAADNTLRGLAMASVPIAAAMGALTTAHLFVVAAIYGLLFMTSAAGIPSLITRLVRGDELITANAMESLSFSLSGLIGPGVAGLLIAFVGAPFVLAIDALTYFVFVACLLAMRRGRQGRGAGAGVGGRGRRRQPAPTSKGLGPAVRFILGSAPIVAITLFYMSVNIAGGIVTVVIPLYVRDVLLGGPATFGLLLSVLTAGDLAGLLIVGAVNWRWPLGRSIAWALLSSGLVILLWLSAAADRRPRGDPVRVGRAVVVADAVGPDDPDAPDPARDARPRLRSAADRDAVDPADRCDRRRLPRRSGRPDRSRSSRSACCSWCPGSSASGCQRSAGAPPRTLLPSRCRSRPEPTRARGSLGSSRNERTSRRAR